MSRTTCPRCKGKCTIIWRASDGSRTGFEVCTRCNGRGYLTDADKMRGDVEIPEHVRHEMSAKPGCAASTVGSWFGLFAVVASGAVMIAGLVLAIRACASHP